MKILLISVTAVWLLSAVFVFVSLLTAPLDTDLWEDGEPR